MEKINSSRKLKKKNKELHLQKRTQKKTSFILKKKINEGNINKLHEIIVINAC